eukprot:TRINITY_DN618_c0_g1_i1.p1 TRINITY_DN618_c0_g1~~TRINITY_DN618_c0_g1_i1.p1  ORF type:complete len:466 (+),score=103.77 TRINITY_DN618_c0_g1_i1:228-1625(+)
MAQTAFQSIAFVPFDTLKSEKLGPEEHEFEISKWLKLENEPLGGLGGNSYSTASDLISNSDALFSTTTIHQMPDFYSTQPNLTTPSSNNLSSGQIQTNQANQSSNQPTFSTQFQFPLYQTVPYNNTYQTIQYSTNQYTTLPYTTFQSAQYNPAYPQYTTQYIPAQFPTNQQSPYTTNIIPAQVLSFGSNPSANGTFQPTQYQYMIYQQPVQAATTAPNTQKAQGETESSEDRKRKHSAVKPFPRRVRQTRPKVVEAKGAVQCKGRNRKKGTQCRNAALMEYIGPRPVYCAEHIELDPKSLYEKCKSSYQKEPGDNKGCKEVVLKEFGTCYKHFSDFLNELLERNECEKIRRFNDRISDLLNQLEKDAAAAKKKDGDLYQRKNKLIPKFQEMKKLISSAVETLESSGKSFGGSLPGELANVSSPVDACIDGLSGDIVDVFTSSEDEDILSSPASSSLEEEFDQILN